MIKLKDLLFERDENDSNDVGGVLYYCFDTVLLCLSSNSGKWHIPKGHIQKGEEPLLGAIREFTEETQIALNGVPELANTYKKDNGGKFYLYIVKGNQKVVPRINHEHSDWGYFDIDNLPTPINKWVKETIEKQK